MKRITPLAAIFVLLAIASVSRAELTNVNCVNDGDGAINCAMTGWGLPNGSSEYYMNIAGSQSGVTGHMVGDFTTNTELDPIIKVTNGIENDSPDVWTDYHINVIMNSPFSILSAFVNTPGNWTIATPIQPVVQVGGLYNGLWLGTINYYSGTPIAIGDELELGYKIKFEGAMSYSYTQEMIYSVPEPSTIAMLLPGLLVGGLMLRRKR